MNSQLLYPGSLHNHSDYSNIRLRDCICKIDDLIARANELGHSCIALTDHECLSGHIKIEENIEKYPNLKIIRGNEIYLVRNGLNSDNYDSKKDKYFHFILLARDEIGHKQIREISTRAWLRSYMARGMRRVPTYYQDLIDIIGANPGHVIGSTACFRAGTQVETKDGWKNIEDIQSGDYVINKFGEWEEVIEPTSMMTHQYGYSLELVGNERPIICTDNHEFLVITSNSKKPKWVQAKDLNLTPQSHSKHIGLAPVNYTYIHNPIIYRSEWNNSYLVENQFSHRTIRLPDKIEITPEIMRLFGLFLGDGCISLKSNPRIIFTFNETEFDNYMDSFINMASQQLNISWNIKKRPENHRVDITSSSADLINLFYYLFGNVKADTKYIPSRLRISRELDYELIFGYLLADGYFRIRNNSGKCAGYKSGEFVSASISKQMSYDLYNILNQINITSSITLSKEHIDKNGVSHKNAWYVSGANKILGEIDKLTNYSHEDIVKIFDLAIQEKVKDFILIDNIKYRKIRFKSATKIELDETVYCLNNHTHSFKCENLIVHNCLGGALPQKIISYALTQSKTDLNYIYAWCRRMIEIFGKGNFYLEMQPSALKDQVYVNKFLLNLAHELDIPYIITTDTHYLLAEDKPIHKAYLNSQNGEREVDNFYATTYLMSDEDIRIYFKYLSKEELQTAYSNIQKIADSCQNYTLKKPLKIPNLPWRKVKNYCMEYPKWVELMPTLSKFISSEYKSDRYLVNAIIDGIKWHEDLQNRQAYDEIEACLGMTWVSSLKNNAQWSAYFLNLQKIIEECWEAGTLVGCGRGSGVGFILLYLLDITQINPLRETTRCFRWRFLNPERVSVVDVDVDIEGGRRGQVLQHLHKIYGNDRVCNVVTFGTEKSKSAILTAARGLGLDVDIASYLSSMIKSERGITQTLDQTFYGDEENDIKPNKQFVYEMTENYPEVWKVAHKIEGLVNRVGLHAGGVIFVDEDFTKSTSLMRAPDGTICTAYELHDCEDVSLIKYDLLSVEALDKIHFCLDLLYDQNYIEQKDSLKETYEDILGVYKIERDTPKMWDMLINHKINALFQMEQQSGIQGISQLKPTSVDDLAVLNSAIRLMAQEKGGEMPVSKLARFKANKKDWDKEIVQHGLNPENVKALLEPVLGTSYGLCIAQEQFMQLVQMEELGGMTLTQSDALRKSIAKKKPAAYDKWMKEYRATCEEKGIDKKLVEYVIELINMSKGYGFNQSHTLAYSLIALQEMNLAYRFPIIFWNCACLISDSASTTAFDASDDEQLDYEEPVQIFSDLIETEEIVPINEEEDDDYEYEDLPDRSGKKKKKTNSVDYGKISTAINKMKDAGIVVRAPDINKSSYTFIPDPENNTIIYGLKGITKVGDELVNSIIANRPYTSIEDFISKNKVNKTQVVNLIKAGAFDAFGAREDIMRNYMISIAEQKQDLNLRNMQMLIRYKLLPSELEFEIRVFNFNKYIKKNCVQDDYYVLTDRPLFFYSNYIDNDDIYYTSSEEGRVVCTVWEKKYKKIMRNVKKYIDVNKQELLDKLNDALYREVSDKYCDGSISKWEMDSISYYHHPHELLNVDNLYYGFADFAKLPEEPEIDYKFRTKDGKEVPMFKIHRIIGTVINKDKNKKLLTLLTTSGVVTVKVFGDAFVKYDKQISEIGSDGKKHVIEKSLIARGNKIIITGIKRDGNFIAKKYKNTPYHLIEQIVAINDDGTIETTVRE